MERTKAQLKKYVETDATSPLVVMRKLLVEGYNATIKGHLDKMVPGVANSYFYILSKPARLELIEMLEAVKAKVDAFSAHFKKVDTKFVCKLAKMCYIEDIKAAQIEFSVLWSAVENLKTQCKGKQNTWYLVINIGYIEINVCEIFSLFCSTETMLWIQS